MFKKLGLIFLFLPLMGFSFCEKCDPADKRYVELDDLLFDATGIWLRKPVDALVVGARALYVDSLGYYVAKNEETWKCPKCGYTNTRHRAWGCANCDWPYDSRP